MKKRSIAALAIILGSAAFPQPIEVRAAESRWTGEGMPSDRSDRWKSSASIGAAMLGSKRYDVAIRYLTAALDVPVKNEDAAYLRRLRGDAYFGHGDRDKAAADYARAVNFVPKDSAGHLLRGSAYERMGNYKAAAADFTKAIALSPDDVAALNALAWLRATCLEASQRDGREAIRAGAKLCELMRWKDAGSIDTLAAAYAETGDFNQAVKLEQQALQFRSIEPDRKRRMQMRLVSYQRHKPHREPANLHTRR